VSKGKQNPTTTQTERERMEEGRRELNGLLGDIRRERAAFRAEYQGVLAEIKEEREKLLQTKKDLVRFMLDAANDFRKEVPGMLGIVVNKAMEEGKGIVEARIDQLVDETRQDIEEFRDYMVGKEGTPKTRAEILQAFAMWMGVELHIEEKPRVPISLTGGLTVVLTPEMKRR
jgi:hypothetical protein